MNGDVDARDFGRGAKRRAKDFRRVLRRMVDTGEVETTEYFDETFRSDISAVIDHLSRGYEAVNAVGLHRSSKTPPHVEQAFFLFHEALNLTFVALRTVRGGSVVASDGVLRQAVELVCVAFHMATDDTGRTLAKFLEQKLHGPKSVTVAKKIYQPIGRLYGSLSSTAVHASLEHVEHSVSRPTMSGEWGRIRIGASFDPEKRKGFKLGIIRIERAAIGVLAIIEAGLIEYVEEPRLWRKTPTGIEWSSDAVIERRLGLAEQEQRAIEEPYTVVYPWAASEDRAEVERLVGAIEGPRLQDVARLRGLAGENPRSFIARYLYGAALEAAGHVVDAASEFEAAWALRPDGYDVWSRLEHIYGRLGETLLENFYRRATERNRENYVAVHNLGRLYNRRGQDAEALECFRRAHALKPERYGAAFNGANCLLRLGRFEQAIEAYNHAAEREPDNPEPWHSAGVAYVRMGSRRAAYRAFRRAVVLDPVYVGSWANLAGVCRELGLRRRAVACATRASRLAPGDERMRTLVEECRAALHRE